MFDIFLFLRSLRQNRIKSIEKDVFKSMSNLQHLWVTIHTYCICSANFIYLPAFLDTGLRRTWGMCTNGTQVPCEVPSAPNPTTREGWPHHRGLRPLLFSNSSVGSFTSHKNKSVKLLWDGTYGFSSLSEKTRKSNRLHLSLQKQHFLLSYLKTLSVGPARVWTRDLPLGRPALSQLS